LLFEQAKQTSPELRSRLMTGIDLVRTRGYEAKLLTRYAQVVITSHRDREAMLALAQRYLHDHEQVAPITIVTNGVDLRYFQPQSADTRRLDKTVVFTGKMSYHANVAGVTYFVERVLPHIWRQDPLVRIQIVGKDPPEAIRQLADDERIHVTGYVDDLRPYLARASVAVCPALYAVGIQNKVLEAMAMATPVVSTRAGCAALGDEADGSLLIADRDADFAEAVLRVIGNPALAGRLSGAGRRYVESHHSWEKSAQQLTSVYRQACHGDAKGHGEQLT
jgi:glycosyltransferase involved in cell wall biosynthesis